jgi:ArsR family transcriptional regulator
MESSCAVVALAALAQDSRLQIFRLLVQAGPEGAAAGKIGDTLNLPGATLSFHLTQLRTAGLVTFRREGRSLIYVAEYDAMNALIGFLTENCCGGHRGACMPDQSGACGPVGLPTTKRVST